MGAGPQRPDGGRDLGAPAGVALTRPLRTPTAGRCTPLALQLEKQS